MAVISTLAAKLTLGTGAFSKGIKSVQSQMQQFAGKLKMIGIAGVAMGAALGTAAVVGTRKLLNDFDELGKASDKLGLLTQSLQQLQYAAGLAGVGSEELQSGMQKMLKTAGDAMLGNATAVESFSQLGISLEQLKSLSTEEMFMKVATAIDGINNPAERAAATMEIFGRSGGNLIPLFNGGAAAIRGAMEEGAGFGLVLDREVAAKAELFNDNLSRVWTSIQGIGATIVSELVPYIAAVSEYFVNLAKTATTGNSWITESVSWITDKLIMMTDLIDYASIAWNAMQGVVNQLTSWVLTGVDKMIKAVNKLLEYIGLGFDYGGELGAIGTEMGNIAAENFESAWNKWSGQSTSDAVRKNLKEQMAKIDDELKPIVEKNLKTAQGPAPLKKEELDKVKDKMSLSTEDKTGTTQIRSLKYVATGFEKNKKQPIIADQRELDLLAEIKANTSNFAGVAV